MKHKVGDVVRVRKDLKADSYFADLYVTDNMAELAGKLVTINSVSNNDNIYCIKEDNSEDYWTDGFFEDEDKNGDVDKIIKEEEKSDEYEDIIDKVLSEMTEETKDMLIKALITGENNITIIATPIYESVCRNSVSIQQIIGTKYGIAIINKDRMVKL